MFEDGKIIKACQLFGITNKGYDFKQNLITEGNYADKVKL